MKKPMNFQLNKFNQTMFAAYKKPLDKAIESEAGGDLGKLLLEILKVGA